MPGKIPKQFIDDLLSRIDIVDVIDARVPLKKAGKDYKACCPFHEEKTPSFTVSQDKQFYHCFGCGVNGSAIKFLMDYEHMSFPEAVKDLAQRAGISVPHDSQYSDDKPDVTAPLLEVLGEADGRRLAREEGRRRILRPFSPPGDVPDPGPPRPAHRLRRAGARSGRTQIPEFPGNPAGPQGPRAVWPGSAAGWAPAHP